MIVNEYHLTHKLGKKFVKYMEPVPVIKSVIWFDSHLPILKNNMIIGSLNLFTTI